MIRKVDLDCTPGKLIRGTNIWNVATEILSPEEYEAIRLRYADECSVVRIAETMACSRIYVRYLLFRARRKLFDAM